MICHFHYLHCIDIRLHNKGMYNLSIFFFFTKATKNILVKFNKDVKMDMLQHLGITLNDI